MILAYSDRYRVDIGAHVFHMGKYALVRDMLKSRHVAGPGHFLEPEPASWDDLALVHDAAYLAKARSGEFRSSELALLELPWSPEATEGFRLMAGGTIAAGRAALASTAPFRAAANLGGGFHHAFPSHGEGFCLFNDVAVAIRVLQRDRLITRAAVIDVDVHQGNGTAFTFEGDPTVFTFSIHQEGNYPHIKPKGSLDVGLPDGADDHEYLHALERALPAVFASRPDLVVYVAGADAFLEDQLGGLNLSFEGLRGRDFAVFDAARSAGVPVVIVLAGGYARRVEDTAAIHAATIEEAIRLGA